MAFPTAISTVVILYLHCSARQRFANFPHFSMHARLTLVKMLDNEKTLTSA